MLQASVSGVIYFGDHLRLLLRRRRGQDACTVKLPLVAASVDAAAPATASGSSSPPRASRGIYR